MVQRPAARSTPISRHAKFSRDQQPTSRSPTPNCVAAEESRVLLKQLLEERFRIVGLISHLHQFTTGLDQVNPAAHYLRSNTLGPTLCPRETTSKNTASVQCKALITMSARPPSGGRAGQARPAQWLHRVSALHPQRWPR